MERELTRNSVTEEELRLSLKELPEQFLIVDLVNQIDFTNRHIPGAMNIPLEELESRLNELPKDKTVIVVSNRGLMKSEMALEQLQNAGFQDAMKLSGGTMGWFEVNPVP